MGHDAAAMPDDLGRASSPREKPDEPAAMVRATQLATPQLGTPTLARRHPAYQSVPESEWADWRWQMRHRVRDADALAQLVSLSEEESAGLRARVTEFSVAVTPYYLSLFDGPDCPVRRQAIPVIAETMRDVGDWTDPLAEDEHSPTPIISHRYPDRALLYATHHCAVYCRHCTRSRKVSDASSAPSRADFDAAFAYLRATPQIRDVLLSGGDPLSLSDARLAEILAQLASIPSIELVRLCTRNPVTLPQRITPELIDVLRTFRPLYVSTHFNHPKECTPEAALALNRLADGGIPVNNQMVLLRGINDDAATVATLNRWLLRQRCRPYYMFQADPVAGTSHLRTPISTGLRILDELRGQLSGLAIPHFAVDLPGGGGKVTLTPERLIRHDDGVYVFRGRDGKEFEYREVSSRDPEASRRRLPVLTPTGGAVPMASE